MVSTYCSLQNWRETRICESLNPRFLALLQPYEIDYCLYIDTVVIQLPLEKTKVQVNYHDVIE